MIRFVALALALALSSPSPAQYLGGLGTGGPSQQHPGYITNRWYSTMTRGLTTTNSLASPGANVVTCSPSYIPIGVVIKTLGVTTGTPFTGGHVGEALYTNSTSHRPGTLIDYAAPASTTVGTTQVSGALQNTIDSLAPGTYWICYSIDNATASIEGTNPDSLTGGWSMGSATIANMQNASPNISGITCTVSGSTCGGSGTGWGVWAAGSFTWGDATAATWTDSTSFGPLITMRVN